MNLKLVKFFVTNSSFFDKIIHFLILFSLLQVTLETLPSLNQKYKEIWYALEIFFLIVFSIEYLLRLYAATRLNHKLLKKYSLF